MSIQNSKPICICICKVKLFLIQIRLYFSFKKNIDANLKFNFIENHLSTIFTVYRKLKFVIFIYVFIEKKISQFIEILKK